MLGGDGPHLPSSTACRCWIAFPLGLLVGLACGCLNGLIVTMLRLPPFIVTLGTWSIFGALNICYSRSETIRQQDIEAAAPFLQWTGTIIKPYDFVLRTLGFEIAFLKGSVLTYGSLLMVVLALIVWYVLNRTAFGRHVYATGDDPDAARLAGINTDRTLIAVYALAGLICAIAAWVLIGRIGGVSPQAGQTANLDSITAVVIGGTSLFGGRGSIIGTLFGALIVGVFRNGLALSGLELLWQDFAVGVLIIVAVTHRPVDQEGFGMSDSDSRSSRRAASSSATVASWRSTMPISTSMPDEILGVIGDNGAGKSTLIKAICGAVIPDEGEILLDGKPVHFKSPMEARNAGIETVYQNLALSPALSIADNMFLGREMPQAGFAGHMVPHARSLRHGEAMAREKLTELGLMTIQNISQAVETLSGGQRQGVAVARAAAFGSKVIIMDEPTAALGVKELRRVLELILDVKRRGLPIVLISHNMPHVFEVADRIHIHRLGRRLCVIDPKEYTMSDAVAFMTGAKTPPEAAMAAHDAGRDASDSLGLRRLQSIEDMG